MKSPLKRSLMIPKRNLNNKIIGFLHRAVGYEVNKSKFSEWLQHGRQWVWLIELKLIVTAIKLTNA